jgi:hypothetical protein
MKTSSSSYGPIIIGILVLIAAAVLYFYYQGGTAPSQGGLSAEQTTDVGLSEIKLLQQIQNINIDTSIFQSPDFIALQDFSVEIPTQPVGRPNPFAPY